MSNWKELQARLNAYQAGVPEELADGSVGPQVPVGRAGNPGRIGPVGPATPPTANQAEVLSPEEFISPLSMRDIIEAPVIDRPGNENYTEQATLEGYGQSRYDTRSGYTPGANREDIRAREQTGANKILSGIAKGAITAADTFLDTTVGSLLGAAYAFSPLAPLWGVTPGESVEAFSTNPVSEKINKFTMWADENIPNYRTEEEQSDDYQAQWYKPSHFFSANNIGDGIIKNFGFTAGAMLGGATWAKVLGFGKAGRLSGDIMRGVSATASGDAEAASGLQKLSSSVRNAVTKADTEQFVKNAKRIARRHNLLPYGEQLTGSIIAAAGEGKTEALMARDEFLDDYIPRLQQETNSQLAGLEQELLQNEAYQTRIYNPDDPDGEPLVVLNQAGQVALQERQNEIYELFRRKQQLAYEQADELAALTFGLNMGILTGSNFVQFGRLLGGGWSSARQAASRVGGRMRFRNGVPVAGYAGPGKAAVAARTVGALGKLGGTEAMEEMLQGTASSGAKQIADDRLTAFNDLSYDPEAMRNTRDAFASFVQGGADYLGDIKNWQEGALGALTGLFGIPGRGYFRGERGGVLAAIAEGRSGVNETNAAAQKLNDYVNNEDFRNRYRNWVRHQALNAKVNQDVVKDDEYAYHTDDDALLINDIIMFSDAGRLDDLKMMTRRFANLSEDDIEDIRQQLSSNNDSGEKATDEEIKERVEKQANKVLEAIKDYGEVQDTLRSIMPVDASSDILKEATFTAMQMNNFENRFLNMLGETIDALDPILAAKVDTNKTAEERKADVIKMQQDYAKIFSDMLVPISEAKRKETTEKLDELAGLVRGNESLEKKVSDMRKLSESRQKLFEKMRTLQSISPEKFEEQAQNEDKVVAEAEKQAAKEEADSLTSFGAVRSAYEQAKAAGTTQRIEFVGRMRKARSANKNVDQFLSVYDAWDELHQDIINNNGGRNLALQIADDIFESATSPEEMLNPENIPAYDRYAGTALAASAGSESSTEKVLQAVVKYNLAADAVKKSMNNVLQSRGKTAAAVSTDKKLKQVEQQKAEKPSGLIKTIPVVPEESTAKEPPQPSSEAQKPKRKKKMASLDPDGQSATDAADNVWTVGEMLYFWDDTKQNVTDSREGTIVGFNVLKNGDVKVEVDFGNRKQKFSLTGQLHSIHKTAPAGKAVEVQTGTEKPEDAPDVKDMAESEYIREAEDAFELQERPAEEEAAQRTDSNGDADYFQLAVPEYPVEDVADIRETADPALFRDKVKKLVPLAQKAPAFEKVMNYLIRNNAFQNTAEAKEGDVVHFKYDPSLGMYNGKPQMVIYVERDGEQRVLNVMRMNHMRDKNGNIYKKYVGLDNFWDQVMKEFVDENTPFTFSKTSTIWAKRPGIITYNLEDSNRRNQDVKEVQGYNPDAPIVWFSREGNPKVIRGDRSAVDAVYSWSTADAQYFRMNNYAGRMYYLADNGAGGYIPVRLTQRHFNLGTYQNDDTATTAVRDSLGRIREIANRFFIAEMQAGEDDAVRQQALAEANERLHEEIANLKGNTRLLLANKMFSFGIGSDGPELSFIRNYKKGANGTQEEKYDRVYIGPAQIGKFEETVASENWAFDFKVDRDEQRAGADMPITRRNLEDYIEAGLLQTNAQSFVPKNVDAYMEPIDPATGEFKKPHNVEEKSNTPGADVNEELPPPPLIRSISASEGEFGPAETFGDLGFAPEFGVDFGEEVGAADDFWSTLDEAGLAYMAKRNITKEKFEAMSPELQEHWKNCLNS